VAEALSFTVKPVYWITSQKEVKAIRNKVFVEEQGVPPELEWDGLDEASYHVLACSPEGAPIGTGRLLQDGRIGRLAVLPEWRGKGVGRALLELLLVIANKMGNEVVELHAQTQVVGFYRKRGFTRHGKEFIEAGIPHVAMKRKTADQVAWPAAFVFRPLPRL
jgi:predicted GNAT family N-acyltransferase